MKVYNIKKMNVEKIVTEQELDRYTSKSFTVVSEKTIDVDPKNMNFYELRQATSELKAATANFEELPYKRVFKRPHDNLTTTGLTNATTTPRWFIDTVVPKNHVITKFSFMNKTATAGTAKIEVWEKDAENMLTLKKTIEKEITSSSTWRVCSVDVDYATTGDTYISIQGDVAPLGYTTVSGIRGKFKSDKTATSFLYNSLTVVPDALFAARIECYENVKAYTDTKNYVADTTLSDYIHVGAPPHRYANIQDALDNCNDSYYNPVTILLHPGVYPRFSMVDGVDRVRYVSIIGFNKHDCIVKDDSGEYATPPAEIWTNGLIKGITFIATHDAPPADPANNPSKAYAMHIDFGSQDLTIEDCDAITYQGPALGIGLHQDETIRLKNVDLYSYSPVEDKTNDPNDYKTNYSYKTNHGVLFVHSSIGENITNQNLILDNVRAFSQNGDRGAKIQKLGTGTCEFNVTARNTTILSYATGSYPVITEGSPTITPDSYGNNADVLNAVVSAERLAMNGDMIISVTPATLGSSAAAVNTAIGGSGAKFTRTVTLSLRNANSKVLHNWYQGKMNIAVTKSSTAGVVAIAGGLTQATFAKGVATVTLEYTGTWAAGDTVTLTATGGTVLGYTVANKTSVDTLIA